MYLAKKHPADHWRDQQDVYSPNVSIRIWQFYNRGLRRKSQSIYETECYFSALCTIPFNKQKEELQMNALKLYIRRYFYAKEEELKETA